MENVWQFIAVAGTAASIAGVILAWQTRETTKLLDRMDARSAAHHATTHGMLDRMDKLAEQRAAQLKRQIDGEV